MVLNWTGLIELNSAGINRVSKISGVYRLSFLNNSNEYIVHYVGQASNLRERLGQHIPANETNSCCSTKLRQHRCFFRAAAVSSQKNRDGVEATLYNHFNPTCVERIPDTQPLNINFN